MKRLLIIADVALLWITLAAVRTAATSRNPYNGPLAAILLVAFIVLNIGLIVVAYRRKIAATADNVLIGTLAKGVRVKRRLKTKADEIARRVEEHAKD